MKASLLQYKKIYTDFVCIEHSLLLYITKSICLTLTEKKCECSECQFCAIFVSIVPFCAVAKQIITIDKAHKLDYHFLEILVTVERTRPHSASFANSVVFPGGVSESVDGSPRWLQLLSSFGYTDQDFEALHRPTGVITPIFQNNPVQRHIQLRISAIRETFEELGLLICSRTQKKDRTGLWASIIEDIDIKYWQNRLNNNPGDLITLCEENQCYPDIWSLHYWSNWLTPVKFPKRFNTAFFVSALEKKPESIKSSSEVAIVEWLSPDEVLNSDRQLYPPQTYELKRLSHVEDIVELIKFARDRSGYATDLIYPVIVNVKDGILHLLPGDDLYPSSIDYKDNTIQYLDKSILELRESSHTLHRFESTKEIKQFVIRNYKPENHIKMEDTMYPAFSGV